MLDLREMVSRINLLLKANGVQKKELAKEIGVSATVFSDWNCGRGKPNIETVVKIAEFFHVSLDYLVYGAVTDIPQDKSELCDITIAKFNVLNTFNQTMATAYIDGLLASQRGANNNGI